MKDQALAAGKRLWHAFLSFTPGQKAVTLVTVGVLVVGGYFFSAYLSKPTYAPLFTNLSPTDASAIIDKLNTAKTPYQLSANGTEILVPQQSVYTARLALSSAGLPTSGVSGYSLLDQEGLTTSEFKQHIDYQRALEGELDKTIKSISGVTDASVHLAIPQQTVFSDGTQKPTAAVLLTIAPGTTLTTNQIQSVVNLVSSAVAGMSPADVSVSDSTGRVLSAAGQVSGAGADSQTEATQQLDSRMTASIQPLLDQLVGVGHSMVTVNAVLNFDKTNTVQHNYVYNASVPPLVESSSNEQYNGSSAAGNGVLGAASPSPSASGVPSPAGSGGYDNWKVSKQNAVGEETVTNDGAPGAIKVLNVAVLLDKNAPPVNQAQITSLVSSAVGLSAKRGDSLSVAIAPFDTTAAAAAAKAATQAAKQASAAKGQAQLVSMIKTAGVVALIAIIFLVTMIANKRRKKTEEPADELDLFLSRLTESPDSLPVAPTEAGQTHNSLASQAARQNDLAQLAERQPDEVAKVLRTWMNSKEG
jgi:flagellar M-ring protein FliF